MGSNTPGNPPNRKRPCTEPPPLATFLTPNRFSPLTMGNTDSSDAMEDNHSDRTETQNKDKCPPLYIYNIGNINRFLTEVNSLNPGKFSYRTSGEAIRLNTETSNGYRAITKYLETSKAEYHTYQVKDSRNFRIVIRGLHHTTDPIAIMDDLKHHGFEPVQAIPALHPVTKTPMPLFFVDIKPNAKNAEVYNINRLGNAVVKIEPPKPKRSVIQCTKCQAFGHSKNYCHRSPKCVKCDGAHSTDTCNKQAAAPPVCTNCKGNHTANYKGCPIHVNLQKSRQNNQYPMQTTSVDKPQFRNSSNEFPPLSSKLVANQCARPLSYASATTQPTPATNANSASEITSLFTKIDQLIGILQPMINLLSQILPKLIK